MPTAEPTPKKPETKVYNGLRFTLKDNGLPDGYALYWFFPEGKPESQEAQAAAKNKYIYTKFHGRGLSCGTKEWQKAVDFVMELRHKARQENAVRPTNLTVQRLLDYYGDYLEKKNAARGAYKPKTAQIVKSTVKSRLGPFFGLIKADKLTHLPEKMTEYRNKRKVELMNKLGKPEDDVQFTIDHELSILRSAYNRAVKDGKIHGSIIPVFNIDKENSKRGTRDNMFTPEQKETLEKCLPEPLNLMLPFALDAGVRKKESTFIHRKLFNWGDRIFKLKAQETKSNEERLVPLSDKLLPKLLAWEEKTKREYPHADYFFHLNGERITEAQVDALFNKTCEDLGWHKPKLDAHGNKRHGKSGKLMWERSPRWHDSRRNATTTGGELEGVKDLDLQRVLGQTEETQDRYDKKQSAIKLRDAINRRNAADAGVMPTAAVVLALTAKAEVTIEDKLIRLKAMFERGLIPERIYEEKQKEMLSAF